MTSRRVMLGVLAIVFVASAAKTVAMAGAMSSMGVMEMPGGWTMSHMWMLMPGQSRLGATASFVGMWVVMMIAMMLPSLTPSLLCYRDAVRKANPARTGWLAALAATGYFITWGLVGSVVFAVGVSVADIAMRETALARIVPIAAGTITIVAGIVQHTDWKARQLTRCRQSLEHLTSDPSLYGAVDYGLRLGLRCVQSCAGLTVAALTLGIMDARVMAGAAVAITAERLAPSGTRVAQVVGTVIVGTGFLLCAGAVVGG